MVLNRKATLIRASSKELNAIILMGISVAYVSVFFYLIKPSKWSCLLRHAGFNFAVSLIYAPILTKTNRVYRIFSAGKRGVKRPAFISNGVQMKLTCFLVGLQVFFLNAFKFKMHHQPSIRMTVQHFLFPYSTLRAI